MKALKGHFKYSITSSLSTLLSLPIFVFQGCTNNANINQLLNTIPAALPNSGTGNNGNQGNFTLSRVVKNALSPNTTLDLIGDGGGAFGRLCQTNPSNGNTINTCNCTYVYSSPTVPHQKVDTPVIYNEADLLRCSYAQVATDVTSMQVSVHLTTGDSYSNSINFNFSGTGSTLDTSLSSSFVEVHRYQCRDIITTNYLLNPGGVLTGSLSAFIFSTSNLYDPIVSEDFHLNYPLDYYYTNAGAAISIFSNHSYAGTGSNSSSGTGNEAALYFCPNVLNPAIAFPGTFDYLDYISNNHVNLTLYSKTPLSSDSQNQPKVMFPPPPHPLANGDIDRTTFYLAQRPTGVFTVPLNAYIAPNVNSITNADPTTSQPGPLGYGASPISSGSGQETCPDSNVTIPPGFHWVKVWLFRASLDQRNLTVPGLRGNGPNQSSSLFDISGVYCNPGDWAPDKYDFPPDANASKSNSSVLSVLSCPRDILDTGQQGDGNPSPASAQGTHAAALSIKSANTTFLADRVVAYPTATAGQDNSQCVRLDAINGDVNSIYNNYQISTGNNSSSYVSNAKQTPCSQGPGLACGSEGEDYWGAWVLDAPKNAHPSDPIFSYDQNSQNPNNYGVYYSDVGKGCSLTHSEEGIPDVTQPLKPPPVDPLNICSNMLPPQQNNNSANLGTPGPPFNTNVTTISLDNSGSRYDFLFVVSPPNVMVADMQAINSTAAPYLPYRFLTDVNCVDPSGNLVTDPDAANAMNSSNCSDRKTINTFGLKLHDVQSIGDPPANDPNRAGVFPLCALQPD